MAINVSVQYNGDLLPDITLLTQGYYHRGTRLNAMYQVEVLSLQPMKQYIITTLFDDVLHCFCFVFVWCPCMAINISVQYNGGLVPDIILLTQCYYHVYVCMVTHIARIWINRVRLPILLVVS